MEAMSIVGKGKRRGKGSRKKKAPSLWLVWS
jgi:hypothetical protein